MTVLSMIASEDMRGERLDRVLARHFADLSRARLQALIRDGAVRIGETADHRPVAEAARRRERDAHRPGRRALASPCRRTFPCRSCMRMRRSSSSTSRRGSSCIPAAGHADGTLVNALIAHCGESLSGIGGVKRPGIVHRLDKDTSGLMVVAKTDKAHRGLAEQFADHGREGPLEREYQAFVWGRPRADAMIVDRPIGRSTRHRERMAVVAEGRGKEAVTHLYVEETFPPDVSDPLASRIRCRLETGRTHQIRVHLSSLGHPLFGDPALWRRLPHQGQQARRALPGGVAGARSPGVARLRSSASPIR